MMTYEEMRARNREATRRYRLAHPERARDAVRRSSAKKHEENDPVWRAKLRATHRRYYERHRERILDNEARKRQAAQADRPPKPTPEERKARQRDKARQWYLANQELTRERARQYRLDHPEQVRAVQRRWRQANPEKTAEYQRRYEAADPERVKEIKQRSGEKRRRAKGILPRPPRMDEAEQRQRHTDARRRYYANHHDDPEWQAARNEKKNRWYAGLPEEKKETIRQARAAWRAANPEKNRAAIKRWEAANSERLKAAQREYYLAHREAHIARSTRRRDLETAAMQFLRERGLLPPFQRGEQWMRRVAALEFVRQAGLLDEGSAE